MKGSREGDTICISDSEGYAEASVFDSWWIRRVKSELGTMIGERIGHEVLVSTLLTNPCFFISSCIIVQVTKVY